jgi:3-hydroxymyristoyl/3-hydroxydecanoyl-(acyl carrier protein) dehydratase
MSQLFQSAIQRILPHRYPFLLVDRVTEFVPGQRIVGVKNFTGNEDISLGYSPQSPQVPTGILLEAVTQLGAILVLERPEMAAKVAVMLQIPSARLLQPVRPGDTLRLEAEVLKLGELFGELRGAAYRDGELIAEGQMRFALASAADVLLK